MPQVWSKKLRQQADSAWEKKLAEQLCDNTNVSFHADSITYTKPATDHVYHPDFTVMLKDEIIYLEAKGRFRDMLEAKKYIHIRDSLDENESLVFIFQNPATPLPGARRRKDGTKRSHADWASANNFEWYTAATIEDLL